MIKTTIFLLKSIMIFSLGILYGYTANETREIVIVIKHEFAL